MVSKCNQILMARGAISEVMYCNHCRVFHVNVNAVTVHFDIAALRDLRDTVSAALAAHQHIERNDSEEKPASQARVRLAH